MFNKKQTGTNYWMSYSDLLTGLVIIFLIISVYFWQRQVESSGELKRLRQEHSMNERQRKQVRIIETAKKGLEEKSKLFKYNEAYKRYELNVDVLFEPLKAEIPDDNKKELIRAGVELQNFVDTLQERLKKDTLSANFAIVIEGRAAKHQDKGSKKANDKANRLAADAVKVLSFERAYALQKLWKTNKILADTTQNYDVLVVGNGFEGKGRYGNENLNKTFIIQIIPKFNITENEN